MSFSTILKITKDDISYEEELRNSHGTFSLLWNVLCKKHLGVDNWMQLGFSDNMHKLWDLVEDESIPVCDRVCLYLTFDGAYVEADKLEWAADHIESFLEVNPVDNKYVNHWPEVARLYRKYAKDKDENFVGIGIYGTSCGDSPYHKWEYTKFVDEKTGEEFEDGEEVPDWENIYGVYAAVTGDNTD